MKICSLTRFHRRVSNMNTTILIGWFSQTISTKWKYKGIKRSKWNISGKNQIDQRIRLNCSIKTQKDQMAKSISSRTISTALQSKIESIELNSNLSWILSLKPKQNMKCLNQYQNRKKTKSLLRIYKSYFLRKGPRIRNYLIRLKS